ncbi:MAG: CotH kinase family protein [Deltaproteobacteria bacterium]|nr:CotH kinase family protein [Deltaproteobacteria bacterium]
MRRLVISFIILWGVGACTSPASEETDSETGSQDTSGTDSNTDVDTDSDTDSDTNSDTDSDTDSDIEGQPIGEVIFADDVLRSYYITISDSEYERLMDMSTLVQNWTVNKDRYVEVGIQVEDMELPSVGMRFKGDWSLISCVINGVRQSRVEPVFGNIDVCQQFSLKLDFNMYDENSRLDGLKKLNLHSMSSDPTKMHERLGYDLFREMDILAPRAVHAKVYINGEYHGLFVAVEQVDGRFTANRFPEYGDGNLYKEIWPGPYQTEAAAVEALKTNDDPDTLDVSDFLAFGDAVTAAGTGDFATTMAPFLDFDYLARYLVVDRAITNFDGILAFYEDFGSTNHNYYWYREQASGRFTLIPWDLDKTFIVPEPNFWFNNSSEATSDLIPACTPANMPNWNVMSRGCAGNVCSFDCLGYQYRMLPLDCDTLLGSLRSEIYARQEQIAEEFIGGLFSEASVSEKLDRWEQQISEALEEDDKVDRAAVGEAIGKLKDDLPALQNNLSLVMGGLVEE